MRYINQPKDEDQFSEIFYSIAFISLSIMIFFLGLGILGKLANLTYNNSEKNTVENVKVDGDNQLSNQ